MAITLTASSTMTWPDSSTQSIGGYTLVPGMLSPGSKWVSYTSPARVNGTTYTNSTGYPLALIITIGNNNYNSLTINGSLVMHPYHGNNGNFMVNAIIPNGATYRKDNGGIVTWYELRN
jgi:hypothetical protein